ncbi:MAG: hypothetical protein ACYCW6_13705 [Candidatus Xenobia bacterium]
MGRAPLLLALLAAILVAGSVLLLNAAHTAASQWRMLGATPAAAADLGGLSETAVQQYVQTEMAGSADLARRPVAGMALSLAALEMLLRSGHVTSALMLAGRLQAAAPDSTISHIAGVIHGYLMVAVIGIVMAGAAFVASYTMWRYRKATA